LAAQKKIAVFRTRPMPYSEAMLAHLKKSFNIKVYYIYSEGHVVHTVTKIKPACEESFFMIDSNLGCSKLARALRTCAMLADLAKWNPDVIFLQGFYAPFIPVIAWSLLNGKKLCLWGDSSYRYPRYSLLKRLRNKIMFPITSRILDIFFAAGRGCHKWLSDNKVPKRKISMAPLTADTFFWEKFNPTGNNKSRNSNNSGRFKILSVGRLITSKGFKDAVCALSLLNGKSDRQISYTIVGDGPEGQSIAEEAEKLGVRTNLVGSTSPEELAKYYLEADVFLLPSHRERWGVVVHEAALFGLPLLLSSKVGAMDDLVEQGVNGFGFAPGSSASIAKAIVKSFSPEFRKKASLRSLQLASNLNERKSAALVANAINSLFRPYCRRPGN